MTRKAGRKAVGSKTDYNLCERKDLYINTLSFDILQALVTLITNTKDKALGMYSIILLVNSSEPPIPGVSTSMVQPLKKNTTIF